MAEIVSNISWARGRERDKVRRDHIQGVWVRCGWEELSLIVRLDLSRSLGSALHETRRRIRIVDEGEMRVCLTLIGIGVLERHILRRRFLLVLRFSWGG